MGRDNDNGGKVNAGPNVYPICVGNGATMQFDDETLFNCVPPQENDVPNDTRWIQWVYGTTTMTATPVSVDGYAGPWPYVTPVITLPVRSLVPVNRAFPSPWPMTT